MIITGMAHFESVCKKKLVEWYNKNGYADTPQTPPADLSNVFVVWSCKTLQNYKALLSTIFKRKKKRNQKRRKNIERTCGGN